MYDFQKFFPFDEPRESQIICIEKALETFIDKDKKFFILEAPPGIGKSGISICLSRFINDRVFKDDKLDNPKSIIATSSRMLQKQYDDTFKDVETLWASTHYLCPLQPDDTEFEDKIHYLSPLCPRKKCEYYNQCEYRNARWKFLSSKIGVLNYHYFLRSKMSTKFLTFDEAHNIESFVCDIMNVTITDYIVNLIYTSATKLKYTDMGGSEIKKIIKRLLNIKDLTSIKKDEGLQQLNSFLSHIQHISNEGNEELKDILGDFSDSFKNAPKKIQKRAHKISKLVNHCQNLTEKIERFFNSDSEWIISNKDNSSISIKPLDLVEMTGPLFKTADKILLMSATICGAKQFAEDIGISKDDFEFISLPSPFPVKNRVIYSINAGSINFKNREVMMEKFTGMMDDIIVKLKKKEGSMRGIIHSVSYANAKIITEKSKFSKNMLVPDSHQIMRISEVLKDDDEMIIVSPRILEGVDLSDSLSRFQFFPKVPYPFLGDAWIKRKMELNPDWFTRQTIIKIAQGSGRSIRSDTDWSYTFILDSNFRRLVGQNRWMIPEWVYEVIKYLNIENIG